MAVYRKQCRRYDDPGHAHALTFSCYHRKPLLGRKRSRQWMLDAIDLARRTHQFHLWAYAIMPEHVHLLIWPEPHTYSISKILQTLKQPVAHRAMSFFRERPVARQSEIITKRRYHFWQRGGGYDCNLFEPKTIWAEINYIHANPVRRGLCERPEDWKWSSAAEYAVPGTGPLTLDLSSLPRTAEG